MTTPPPGLPGLTPRWSRHVTVPGTPAGPPVTWHLLDNAVDLREPAHGTLLAVHGNPTWSYLWRDLLTAGAAAGWRVVAVDHPGMGWSQRDGRRRRLADRVTELSALTDHLGLAGRVVTVGHDWGGVVSLGWAARHPDLLAGLVLTNTAVHHDPDEAPIPSLLRLAGHPAVHRWATSTTRTFLRTTLALASPPLPDDVRRAYLAPYENATDRQSIADFVADIPVGPAHPSHETLRTIAAGTADLHVPALILWGPRDPVFHERYLRDLRTRLPHADVHRFVDAGHLLPEDADVAGTVIGWLAGHLLPATADRDTGAESSAPAATTAYRRLTAVLDERERDGEPAVLALSPAGTDTVTWHELATKVRHLALGLADLGVRPGQRVSLLITPGVELTTALFACLRLGAIVVLADQGLGLRGMSRALRGTGPQWLIGIDRGLAGARVLGWPGRRVAAGTSSRPRRWALGAQTDVTTLTSRGARLEQDGGTLPAEPGPEDDAAILFTSGSTGPAKGVTYTHRRLAAMRDALATTYGLGPGSAFVVGFAPFALIGTALGSAAITPDMDVTAPATLTATALADAVAAGGATAVFTSPAALVNVLRTADDLTETHRGALAGVSLFLSAGAPITPDLLAGAQRIMPNASAHTPYGMTEVLPVTDIDLAGIRAAADDEASDDETGLAGAGGGSCVGTPVPGARIRIIPLDDDGAAAGAATTTPGITGEVLVTAAHLKRTYDQLWATQAAGADHPGWHRTGDVGHLDTRGRLWIEGRLDHIIRTARGVVTPVVVEHAAQQVRGVQRAAAVGVGPVGNQHVVLVLETDPHVDRRAGASPALATPGLTRLVRQAVGTRCDVSIAAVLRVPELPTDVRHNAKVDRARLARWAHRTLAGGRMGAP